MLQVSVIPLSYSSNAQADDKDYCKHYAVLLVYCAKAVHNMLLQHRVNTWFFKRGC
jgi:hypothetical protein